MGAWGDGPFDNDPAGDIIAGLMKPVREIVDGVAPKPQPRHKKWSKRHGKPLPLPSRQPLEDNERRYRYCAARVAIALCLQAYGTDILGGFSLDTCEEALRIMLADSAWLAEWRDPFAVQRSIQKQILLVQLRRLEKTRSAAIDLFAMHRERMERVSKRRPRTTRAKVSKKKR